MLASLWRRLTEIVRTAHLDRETAAELFHHVEMMVAQKVEAGLSAEEARRQARIELGAVETARVQVAEERSGFALERLWRETGYAVRVLRRSPLSTTLSIVTMAAGIGASAILFVLVSGIVLTPLPYPAPDRLVRIFDTHPGNGIDRTGTASGNIGHWRQRATGFDGISGFYAMGRTVSGDSEAEAVITAQVSADFFRVMGVPALRGRTFTVEEAARATFNSASAPTGTDPVVILSHGLWVRRFGSDPAVIGRPMTLERRPFTVVGVMPPGFHAPDANVQAWIPWHIGTDHPRDQHYVGAVARLTPGVTIAQAEAHLNQVARELGDEFPDTNRGWGVQLSPLAEETIGGAAGVLWLLFAAVALVLLVACANVALLSIIRGIDRAEETSVRVALGASTTCLMREFLLETGILSLAGGGFGAAVAFIGVHWLPSLSTDLPRLEDVSFDGRAVGFIAAVTVLSALLSGVPHAWQRSRRQRIVPLGGLRMTDRPGTHRVRDAMVVAQVATAVILMLGSGLLMRSFLQLRSTDTGFDPSGVLVAPVFLNNQQYRTGEHTRTYYRSLFERLSAIPGVEAVGGATTVPSSPLGPDFERPVWRAADADGSQQVPAAVRMITPGYIPAMGLRVIEGRAIDDRDSPLAPRVLMISESLARNLWPGEPAVGRQLTVDYSTAGTYPYEVVGVMGDVRFRGPRSEPLREIYIPHAQRSYLILNVVVKTTGDPRAIIPQVRAALRAVDQQTPAQGLLPLADLLGATYARDRQVMATMLIFAAAAMVLAALSVYGVMSQRVRERAREIGIRMAMGASDLRVLGWLAMSGLRLIAIGLLIGAVAAGGMTGAIRGWLFGVTPTDAVAIMGSLAGLTLLGLAALVIPSWRATRINPVEILRRG
jgi:putative ABC transport system permease protein